MASASDQSNLSGIHELSFETELNRIRAAYQQRNRDVPAERYSEANPRAAVFYGELERRILGLLTQKRAGPLAEKRIFDVGCGEGRWIRRWIQWGALPENVAGMDLLPERIAAARRACHPAVQLHCGNAARIRCADACIDIVACMTVFSSILDCGLRQAIAGEMLRVLRPGGFILWYDFFVQNPGRRDVRGVGRAEIPRLFPGCEIELRRVTVAAPLGRALATFPRLYAALAQCRVFSTHYLGWICKA